MQIAKGQCLPSAKTRSCREYARLPAFLLAVFFTCAVLIQPGACRQASPSSMQRNSTLLSNQTLVSPGGVFELGFYSATRAQVSSPVYTLAIWYANSSPAKTVVWLPDRTLALSEHASLSLSPQGDLQVHDNIGSPQLMWTSNTAQLNGTTATILDTGNLVVVNSTNNVVWQSFDSLTDTLLPNQSYTANSTGSMKAWRASGDWRDGPYSLNWDIVSVLNAFFGQTKELWYCDTTLGHPTNYSYWSFPTPASSVSLTKQGEFQSISRDQNKTSLIGSSKSGAGLVSTRLLRLTLDADGNLRMYSWMNGSSAWEVEWEAVADACLVYSYCGPFGLCTNNGECNCPVGFQFVTPLDPRQGCSRISSEALCSINNLVPIQFIDFPYSGDYLYSENMTFEACLQSCLSDCYCQAALIKFPEDGATNCWLKRDTLLNGQYHLGRIAYMRVPVQPPSGLSESDKINLVASSLGVGTFILGLLLSVFAGFSLAGKMKQSRLLQLQKKWATGKDASLPVSFTFEDIQLITNNFAMDTGIGSGSGTVFKGHIDDPSDPMDVAVKLLHDSGYEANEFINRVDIIGQIHHFHLLNLLGYCAEAEHRILVYEHVEDGSLDGLLFPRDKSKSVVLEWRPRFQIAIQTAQALAYMHDECRPSLVHGNVKPETILVDSMLCVKVANFGLSSSISGREPIQTNSTRESLAPACTNQEMPVTSKSDVFSFGMLLLELLSGRRNVTTSSISHQLTDLYFPSWAYPYIETASFMDVLDPSLTGIVNSEEVQRALLVAFWCINDQPQRRPSMAKVVQMLEGEVPVEVPVPRPNFLDTLQMEEDEEGPNGHHYPSDVLMTRSDFSKDLLFEDGEDGSPLMSGQA